MFAKYAKITVIFLLTVLLMACVSKDKDKPDVVAQVNEAVMTNSELNEAISPAASADVRLALKRKLMEQWVENEIFYQAALEEGMALTEYEEIQVLNYRKQLILEKYLSKYLNKKYNVLDQEIDDYYSAHRNEFVWDGEYANIIHLVLDSNERVIRDEVGASKDLMEVIRKNFFDQKSTSARPIGNLGYVKLSDLPAGLVSQIKNAKTGTIRGPIKTDLGYHYVQVLDFQKAGAIKEPELVRNEIVQRIQMEKRKNELEDLKRKLRENFTIQTDLTKLTQP